MTRINFTTFNFVIIAFFTVLIYVIYNSPIQQHLGTFIDHTKQQVTKNNNSCKGEFEFIAKYDINLHIRLQKKLDDFMKYYRKYLVKDEKILYSNYRKHTHRIHKLEDVKKHILLELSNTVYIMSDNEFRFLHKVPEKIDDIEHRLKYKIKILCHKLGIVYNTSDVEPIDNQSSQVSFYR